MNISDWSSTTINSISDYWARIIDFTPKIVGAIIIVIIGLLIARILKWAVITILDAAKVQKFFDRINFTEVLKKAGINFKASETCGNFVGWLTTIVFLIPASKIIGLDSIADLLENLIKFIPNIIIAMMIILIGSIIANLLSQIVKAGAASIGATSAKVLSVLTRYIVYIFIGFTAFYQLNIPSYLINVMFTGLVAAMAIAGGLSFGLGGQSAAADLVKKIRDDFKK